MEIILYQPQIPQNTGNILRTCFLTGTSLSLIRPLGFKVTDKQLRRAGIDYFNQTDIHIWDSWEAYLEAHPTAPRYFFSSKATKRYVDTSYPLNGHLIFGAETTGLPESITTHYAPDLYTIPMRPHQRCLNLSCSVSIVLYEALRQQDFRSLYS